MRYRFYYQLIWLWLGVFSFAAHAQPDILSPIFQIKESTSNKIVLDWNLEHQDDPNGELDQERILLFAPGNIDTATVEISDFTWQEFEHDDLVRSGNHTIFPATSFTKPRVQFKDMGFLQKARLGALTLSTSGGSHATQRFRFPQGQITITFNENDPQAFEQFSPAIDTVARTLVANYPPRKIIETKDTIFENEFLKFAQLKLITTQEGMVRISGAELLQALSQPIDCEHIALVRDHQPIPFQILNEQHGVKHTGLLTEHDELLFYAPISQSAFSPQTVTWLCVSNEHQLRASVRELSPSSLEKDESLYQVRREEEDNYFIEGKNKTEEQNHYWMWHDLSEGTFVAPLNLPAIDTLTNATLSIETRVEPDYVRPGTDALQIQWNQTDLPSITEEINKGVYVNHATIPSALLTAGTHVISVSSQLGQHRSASQHVDRFEICYARPITEATLAYRHPGETGEIIVPPAIDWVWQLTDSDQQYFNIRSGSGYRQLAVKNNVTKQYFGRYSLTESQARIPVEIALPHQGTLLGEVPDVDYVIISPIRWLEHLDRYNKHLNYQGFRTVVLPVEALYDQFGDGRLDPHAIKRALRYLNETSAFSYVLLVGDATWDYWGRYQNGVVNELPAYRENPSYAVENWFVRFEDDRVPDAIIGRVPVRDEAELNTFIEKSINYQNELQPEAWLNHVFMLTDDGYERYSDELMAEWLPTAFRQTRRHIADYPLIDNVFLPEAIRREHQSKTSLEATADVISILNQGMFLWQYFGHGAPNVIGEERILFGGDSKNSDVKKLNNQHRLPVLWAFTCETAYFDFALEKWNISLGEEMLIYPDGGVIGLLGATGRGYPFEHVILARALNRYAFQNDFSTHGQLFFAANLLGMAQTNRFEPVDQFAWLGDPALGLPEFYHIEGYWDEASGKAQWEFDQYPNPTEEITTWIQTEKDFTFLQDETPRNLQNHNMQALGIETMVKKQNRIQIRHGAVPVPEPVVANLIVPATVSDVNVTFVPQSIHVSPPQPRAGQSIFISATLKNDGIASATKVEIKGYFNDVRPANQMRVQVGKWGAVVDRIDPGEEHEFTLRWDPFDNAGKHQLILQLERIADRALTEKPTIQAPINVTAKADLVVLEDQVMLMPVPDGRQEFLFAFQNIGETDADKILVELTIQLTGNAEPIVVRLPQVFTVSAGERINSGGIKLPDLIEWIDITIDPDGFADETTHGNNEFRFIPD